MPKEKSEKEMSYLEMQAEIGIAKHIGGMSITKKMISLCNIKPSMHILDVGCGIGTTSCLLAEKYGCIVTGIDISPKMVEWANNLAKEKRLEGKVSFMVADAQKQPFENSTFDAVISESVTVFIPDKKRALREYVRVLKKGGYLGINESTWIKKPVSKEVIDYWRIVTPGVEFFTSEEFASMLKAAGLKEIKYESFRIGYFQEFKDRLELLGIKRIAYSWLLFIWKFITKPYFREYVIRMSKSAIKVPKDIFDYMGYGIYVGRK